MKLRDIVIRLMHGEEPEELSETNETIEEKEGGEKDRISEAREIILRTTLEKPEKEDSQVTEKHEYLMLKKLKLL